MADAASFEKRIEALETAQKRWQKIAALALIAALASVSLLIYRYISPPNSIWLNDGDRTAELSPGRLRLSRAGAKILLTTTSKGGVQIISRTKDGEESLDVILGETLSSLRLRSKKSASLTVSGGEGSMAYNSEQGDGKGEYGLRILGRVNQKWWSSFFGNTPEGVRYNMRGVDQFRLSGKNGVMIFDPAEPALKLEGQRARKGASKRFGLEAP